jgi:hypothetical protein
MPLTKIAKIGLFLLVFVDLDRFACLSEECVFESLSSLQHSDSICSFDLHDLPYISYDCVPYYIFRHIISMPHKGFLVNLLLLPQKHHIHRSAIWKEFVEFRGFCQSGDEK